MRSICGRNTLMLWRNGKAPAREDIRVRGYSRKRCGWPDKHLIATKDLLFWDCRYPARQFDWGVGESSLTSTIWYTDSVTTNYKITFMLGKQRKGLQCPGTSFGRLIRTG